MSQTEQDLEQRNSFALDDIIKEYKAAAAPEDYQIPDPEPAPHRSSLPTEEEVRAYLASYARGEAEPSFEPRRKAGPEPPELDSRFVTAESRAERRRLRYGSADVDNSADESYQPPETTDYIPTNVDYTQEEETPDEPVKPVLFKRWRDKMAEQRRERDRLEARRRAAAEKVGSPEPEDLLLPGEEPPAEEEAPRPAPEAAFTEPETEAEAAQPASEEPEAPAEEKPQFTPSWSRNPATYREYVSLFPDTSASPAIYADEPDDDMLTENGDASIPLKKDNFFPSFKEYLTTLLTTTFYGLRKGAETIITAEEDDEELGPEATAAYASKYYGRFIQSQRKRLRLCALVLLVMGWISLGLPVFGQLHNIRVAAWFCFAMQAAIMLLCQDVLTGGVLNAFRRRFGADSLAVTACLLTGLDALLVGTGKLTAPHMPFCLASSLSLTGILLSSLFTCRGLRKSLRVPSIAKRAYTVTGEMNMKEHGTTILKSQRSYAGFVRRSEEAPPDETLFQKIGLLLLVLAAFFGLLTIVFTRNIKDMFYIFSVLVCAAIPFGALLCFALPYMTGSFRIFPSGAAVAGWSGLYDIGRSKNLIVTDRDLFPDGTVEIEQVRVFADAKPSRIISYAGSMLIAAGSCVAAPFAELMEKNGCAMRQIEDFEYLPGGGMRGVIDSSVILCGSSDLMQLMNVRIPFRLVTRTSILLSVDGVLYGIFNIKYKADPLVRRALVGLIRSSRHPIFAIRDFNVTPAMLHETFDVPTDGYDFPPYVERFDISSAKPGDDSKPAAVVCRDGLGPLTRMADTGRKMYVATRTNLYCTVAASVLGVLLCFLRMVASGGVSVLFLFLYMLITTLPVLFLGTTLSLE